MFLSDVVTAMLLNDERTSLNCLSWANSNPNLE